MNLKLRCLRRGFGSADAEVSQLGQGEPALRQGEPGYWCWRLQQEKGMQ